MQLVGIQIYNLDIARIKNNTKMKIKTGLSVFFGVPKCNSNYKSNVIINLS